MTSHVRDVKADAKLAEAGRAWRRLKAQAKAAEEDAAMLQRAILEDLDRRGVESVTVDGLQIKRRQRVTRTVDLDKLKKLVGIAAFRQVTKLILNTGTWNAAINEGVITADVIKRVEVEQPTSSWIEAAELA